MTLEDFINEKLCPTGKVTAWDETVIRTALALLIDRDALCANITPGAQQSANAPIPPGISDAGGSAFTAHNGLDGKGGRP